MSTAAACCGPFSPRASRRTRCGATLQYADGNGKHAGAASSIIATALRDEGSGKIKFQLNQKCGPMMANSLESIVNYLSIEDLDGVDAVRRALGCATDAAVPERPPVLPPRTAGPPDAEIDRLKGSGELGGRPADLIGLVTFARYPDTICPLTLDHDTLVGFLPTVKLVTQESEDGTAIGDARCRVEVCHVAGHDNLRAGAGELEDRDLEVGDLGRGIGKLKEQAKDLPPEGVQDAI